MEISLKKETVEELKMMIKKYDIVSGINSMKKSDLLHILNSIKKYKEDKQTDYHKFTFGDKIVKLNDEQYKVVTSDMKQNIRVIASAGSGKSSTIICRIKYLIDQGVDSERILVTAFNVDAVESIKSKLIALFGFLPKVCVGTIDSIACRFYHKYFRQDYNVGVSEYSHYFLKYLQSEGNLVSNLYYYVFFDEAQDLNSSQFEIARCFYNSGAYVTLIGDDGQNLYGFRGADVKYILNLDQHFKNLKTYKLIQNYRSTPEIINLANASIKFNTEQIPKEMLSNNPSIDFKPNVKYYENFSEQNSEIMRAVLELNKAGTPLDEIAILSRINSGLKLLEEEIEKFNKQTNDSIKYVSLISDDGDNKPKIKPGHLTLTTIHKSKGLEWKVVFIIGCDDAVFPSETDKLSIQEERRLFYVATTRAKQYLYILFCGDGKKNSVKKPKITRFIQELDRSLYEFPNYDKKYYSYDDYRSVKWHNGVTETIKMLNESDIAKLRELNILPTENPLITKIHDKHEFNSYINTYYLQTDFGEFIDRFISRSIGRRNKDSAGLIDLSTVIIISSCQFTNEELLIYKKYQNNLKINIKKINLETPDWQYTSILCENNRQLKSIKQIDINDSKNIRSIVQKILLTANKFNIDINILTNCFSIKNEVPDRIKKVLLESYKRYLNVDNVSSDISRDIYNISLCGTILSGRRRLLYKDVYIEFKEQYDSLFNDIEKYIETLNPEFTNLISKKLVRNDDYDLMGEIDLLNIDGNKIIDFKCSSTDKFKLEWILQLLGYLAIIRKSYPDIVIKDLEVYNPMMGEMYTLDVSDWNKETEYLSFLYEIRIRQATRNLDAEQSETINYPIKYDNFDKIKKNENENEDLNENADELKLEVNRVNIYDLKTLFGDDYNEYLEYINKNKDKFVQHCDSIDRFNTENNRRYMVVDTETTGIPRSSNGRIFAPYSELDKYKNARMIQICWAVYNGDVLEEFENHFIKPVGFKITNSFIHGITQEMANKGKSLNFVLGKFSKALERVKYVVGHNEIFDRHVISSELYRNKFYDEIKMLDQKQFICTMKSTVHLKVEGRIKPVKLIKLYKYLFGKGFNGAHDAANDVKATVEIFHELLKRKIICI